MASFTIKGGATSQDVLNYAGADLSHILLAVRTTTHASLPLYHEPAHGVNATIHQHIGLGRWSILTRYSGLREMDFANRTFKVGGEAIITTSLFGYPEKMSVQAVETRERIEAGATPDVKTGGFACTAPQAGAVGYGNYPSFSASSRTECWKI